MSKRSGRRREFMDLTGAGLVAAARVEGSFFDDTKLQDKRELNVHDLDEVSKDHPVAVRHRGGHTSYYNTKAFELAGITKTTPDPPGGTFDKDELGDLNGRVTDQAMRVFNNVGNRIRLGEEERQRRDRDGLAYISKQFVRYALCCTERARKGATLIATRELVRYVGRYEVYGVFSRDNLFSLT